jgi:hypothetical protein
MGGQFRTFPQILVENHIARVHQAQSELLHLIQPYSTVETLKETNKCMRKHINQIIIISHHHILKSVKKKRIKAGGNNNKKKLETLQKKEKQS